MNTNSIVNAIDEDVESAINNEYVEQKRLLKAVKNRLFVVLMNYILDCDKNKIDKKYIENEALFLNQKNKKILLNTLNNKLSFN